MSLKPHLALHQTKHTKEWWVSAHYPWDKGYTLMTTANHHTPVQAIRASASMCIRMAAALRRHERSDISADIRRHHFGVIDA